MFQKIKYFIKSKRDKMIVEYAKSYVDKHFGNDDEMMKSPASAIYNFVYNAIEWSDKNRELDLHSIIDKVMKLQDQYYSESYHPFMETEMKYIEEHWND